MNYFILNSIYFYIFVECLIYGLAAMVLLMKKNPSVTPLVVESAKQALRSKKIIDTLLKKIEVKNKPNKLTTKIK
jgi:hypothetical protein